MSYLGDRIKAAGMERVAPEETPEGQPGAPEEAVPFDRLPRIDGAGRLEAACAGQPR